MAVKQLLNGGNFYGQTLVLLVLSVALWTSAAAAQHLPVAGSKQHLWLVLPGAAAKSPNKSEGPTSIVYHRGYDAATATLTKVQTLRGRVVDRGLAATGNRLWLIYADGTVQWIEAEPAPMAPGWRFNADSVRSLPPQAKVRAMTASSDGPWVLMSAKTAALKSSLATPPASTLNPTPETSDFPPALFNRLLGLPPPIPPETRLRPVEKPAAAPSGQAPAVRDHAAPALQPGASAPAGDSATAPKKSESTPSDSEGNPSDQKPSPHLLHMVGDGWRQIPLPDDWPAGPPAMSPLHAWLVVLRPRDDWPVLLVQPRPSDHGDGPNLPLWVYHRSTDGTRWKKQTYKTTGGANGAGGLAALAVEDQLVIGQREGRGSPLRVRASVLRGGRVLPVGVLNLGKATGGARTSENDKHDGHERGRGGGGGRWEGVPSGPSVAVVAQAEAESRSQGSAKSAASSSKASPDEGAGTGLGLRWARLGLTGTVLQQAQPLTVRSEGSWSNAAEYVIVIGVGATALLLMLLFWRRTPEANQVTLPAGVVLAGYGRRILAGVIDVAPAAGAVLWWFDLTPRQLLVYHWPGAVPSFEASVPGAVVIGLFLVHTIVCEMLTRRTLGKLVTGLKVADMQGQSPRRWQTLVRGGLKTLDLIAWLLLLLPVIGPHRQRLGDLIARTIVVHHESDDAEDENVRT